MKHKNLGAYRNKYQACAHYLGNSGVLSLTKNYFTKIYDVNLILKFLRFTHSTSILIAYQKY